MWLRRFGFRFAMVFLATQLAPFPLDLIPKTDFIVEPYGHAWEWGARHLGSVLGYDIGPAEQTGSGDQLISWMTMLLAILLSIVIGAAWTILDRKRAVIYPRLAACARVGLRYWLGYAMLGYGWAKVFKVQFPYIGPSRLDEPIGEMSPMGILWMFMGYSTPYNVFAGAMECLGGVLLLFRRTTMAGSLVVIAVMTNVVMLNFCYDVPVKLYSSLLLLFAIVLLAPDLSRLVAVLLGHAAPPAAIDRLRLTRRWRRIIVATKVILIGWIFYSGIHTMLEQGDSMQEYASPIDGRYDVVELSRPELGWSHIAVEYKMMTIWSRTTDRPDRAQISIDGGMLTITGKTMASTLHLAQAGDTIVAYGDFGKKPLRVVLRRRAPTLLETRGFNWVNEYPFNR